MRHYQQMINKDKSAARKVCFICAFVIVLCVLCGPVGIIIDLFGDEARERGLIGTLISDIPGLVFTGAFIGIFGYSLYKSVKIYKNIEAEYESFMNSMGFYDIEAFNDLLDTMECINFEVFVDKERIINFKDRRYVMMSDIEKCRIEERPSRKNLHRVIIFRLRDGRSLDFIEYRSRMLTEKIYNAVMNIIGTDAYDDTITVRQI